MAPYLQSLLLACALLHPVYTALIPIQLVGTWSTKSGKVLTGPGFYDPVNDSFIEPSHTGISYSFTADGYYEEAYYRAIANPTTPKCPEGILQFQHGRVTSNADGSLKMSPFAVDGRQLLSNPCGGADKKGAATYTRYNQSETMKKWQVYTDPYNKLKRLDLYGFDGTPVNPMFLAHNPPKMLPKVTMNPTVAASPSSTGKAKRGLAEEMAVPLNKDAAHIRRETEQLSFLHRIDINKLWWAGVGMTVFGGVAYFI